MESFTERLSGLPDLSEDELDALEAEMIAAFDAADEAGDVDAMQSLADGLDSLREEKARRTGTGAEGAEEVVPEEVVAASASTEEVDDMTGENTPVEDEAVTADATEEVAAVEEIVSETEAVVEEVVVEDTEAVSETEVTEAVVDTATEEVEVKAATPETQENITMDVEITAEDVPESSAPDTEALAASAAPLYTITAGGDVPGITAGSELTDMDAVSEAMAAKVNSMRGIGGDGEHVVVASIRGQEAPEERTLSASDTIGNNRKIRALIEDQDALTAEALTAAGWCAPKAPVYDIPTIGTTDRPVANMLPTFSAERGGIIWTAPPSLASLTALITAANSPFGVFKADGSTYIGDGVTATTPPNEKPCFTIPCGTDKEAELEALTLCLCFDNLSTRAYPEWIRANTDLLMVAQARISEQYLLGKLFGAVAHQGKVGTPDIPLGAARDFLVTVRVAASEFRWANRLSPTQPLQILVPSWLRDAMAADLAIQIPGDSTLSVSYSEVEGYMSDLHVSPIWYLDDVVPEVAGSNFDSLEGFAQTAQWLMFPTGSFVRLDGGSLDLGVVRSKEDIKKNTYCEFSESFEAVAYMGPDTPGEWVVNGQTAIEIRGGYAPAVAAIPSPAGMIAE